LFIAHLAMSPSDESLHSPVAAGKQDRDAPDGHVFFAANDESALISTPLTITRLVDASGFNRL